MCTLLLTLIIITQKLLFSLSFAPSILVSPKILLTHVHWPVVFHSTIQSQKTHLKLFSINQPWVGIATSTRNENDETRFEKNDTLTKYESSSGTGNKKVTYESNQFINIETSKDYYDKNDTSSWLKKTINPDDNDTNITFIKNTFDLSSPREWLEYNEVMNKGIHGAYTVIRCDLSSSCNSPKDEDKSNDASSDSNNNRNRAVAHLWGKEFHLNRLSNSFIQMMTTTNNQLDEEALDEALNDSETILNELIHAAVASCLDDVGDQIMKINNDDHVKIVMITLLWTEAPTRTPSYDKDRKLKIHVQGHSFCSNTYIDPKSYNPNPITASIAIPLLHETGNPTVAASEAEPKLLPSRYKNLPEAKLSSWCRIRRPLEQMYKDDTLNVGEVLLARNSSAGDVILLEGLTSNLFIVYKDGSIHTSHVSTDESSDHYDDGGDCVLGDVLGGYARQMVLQTAKQLNIPIVYGPISLEDGRNDLWAEAFITSSIKLIAPVDRMLIPTYHNVGLGSDGTETNCVEREVGERVTLEEFWCERSLESLPWEERMWYHLYGKIISQKKREGMTML